MTGTWVRWIPALPLFAALLHGLMIGLLRRSLPQRTVTVVSIGAAGGAFVISVLAFAELIGQAGGSAIVDRLYTWIGLGVGSATFTAEFALRFDALSAVMCLVVTGVGLLIQIYSVAYMEDDRRDDRGYQRFFCFTNLFLASMLVLVLADNVLLMFLGWEAVGLCSYLLIGFWYGDEANARAGSKAFIVNRVGDLGFLVGTLLLFWSLAEAGTPGISFQQIRAAMPVIEKLVLPWPALLGGGEIGVASVLGLCFFVAACGKSAQLPLFVWLPDAMAGPTPVSALIHAATMVTAGVYLIARLSFLYLAAPEASALIAWTGALTALCAALVACVQTDIKRVLAYSTISQLGYMFLAAGAGAHTAAIFHVVAHAFFKALLFMVAGAMILALHHEQDMRRMGGIGSRMPLTRYCMFFGALTMAGVPGGAGFFSKEQILLAVHSAKWLAGYEWLYAIAMGTVAITAFYSIRLIYLPLYGESRVSAELRREIQDPGPVMLGPMAVLAALCVLGSFIGTPQLWGELLAPGVEEANSIHHFLKHVVALPAVPEPDASEEWGLTGRALVMTAIGALPAVVLYLYRREWPERIAARLGFLQRLLANAFYVDALYQAVIVRPLLSLSDRVLSRWIDAKLIDGFFVMGTANAVRGIANGILKRAHSGLTQAYFVTTILGSLAILAWLLFAGGG